MNIDKYIVKYKSNSITHIITKYIDFCDIIIGNNLDDNVLFSDFIKHITIEIFIEILEHSYSMYEEQMIIELINILKKDNDIKDDSFKILYVLIKYSKYFDSEMYLYIPEELWNCIGSRLYIRISIHDKYTNILTSIFN
jgi:hypothetical protein